MATDDPFPYDVEEIIERGLSPFRPVLSYLVLAHWRSDLHSAIASSSNLQPLADELLYAANAPSSSCRGPLTPGQIALLGGTRPQRVLETIADDLELPLDGGTKRGRTKMLDLLLESYGAAEALADQHAVVPPTDLADCVRQMTAFVDLALTAMYAGLIVAYMNSGRPPKGDGAKDEAVPYLVWALHAFMRVEIKGLQRKTFRDYYWEQRDPEEVAEERDHSVGFEIERRRVFLSWLGTQLKAEIARISREVCPEPARTDLKSSPWLRTLVAHELLGRQTRTPRK